MQIKLIYILIWIIVGCATQHLFDDGVEAVGVAMLVTIVGVLLTQGLERLITGWIGRFWKHK